MSTVTATNVEDGERELDDPIPADVAAEREPLTVEQRVDAALAGIPGTWIDGTQVRAALADHHRAVETLRSVEQAKHDAASMLRQSLAESDIERSILLAGRHHNVDSLLALVEVPNVPGSVWEPAIERAHAALVPLAVAHLCQPLHCAETAAVAAARVRAQQAVAALTEASVVPIEQRQRRASEAINASSRTLMVTDDDATLAVWWFGLSGRVDAWAVSWQSWLPVGDHRWRQGEPDAPAALRFAAGLIEQGTALVEEIALFELERADNDSERQRRGFDPPGIEPQRKRLSGSWMPDPKTANQDVTPNDDTTTANGVQER